ncbi:MAG: nucleoside-diphosphate kinase [Caldilinea sp.]|nr:nucleoside-diphosphate kinase [Caldilinea sp.]MCB0056331.1 nucleoside-diphosphate kinase [Caldilineaceae bacterium]MCB0041622.1 nucleoside-diphosphate kinase [Caldilinea sp.]MCB0049088.1 nucleoside-diphosphate kinase [Caldilinea sp.]MCB0066380.1 nucleoside-diphosphate kinase [Caldilineaceae bacterium]
MERTFVMVKPDGVQRGLIGEIIGRFERRGLKIVGLKMVQVSEALARQHYAVHEGRPFFAGLITYITSAPVVAMVVEGTNAVVAVRQTVGATKPFEAAPGTIRADFALEIGRNLVHASDGQETAATEIALWFGEELVAWDRAVDAWIFE